MSIYNLERVGLNKYNARYKSIMWMVFAYYRVKFATGTIPQTTKWLQYPLINVAQYIATPAGQLMTNKQT